MKRAILLLTIVLLFYSNTGAQTYAWVDISSNIPLNPDSILFNDVYAIGDKVWICSSSLFISQYIFYSEDGGTVFSMQPITAHTTSIVMRNDMEGYVGDYDGRVHRTTNGGNNWTILPGTLLNIIRGIDFPPTGENGFICGNNGWVGKFSSTGIFDTERIVNSDLFSISFPTDTTEGWVCGTSNVIRHYMNGNWVQNQAYPNGTFQDVFFVENTTLGWAVGYMLNGNILHTTGGNWFIQPNPDTLNPQLDGVFFLNTQEGWAVGYNRILHTTDGGNNWAIQDTTTSVHSMLLEVYFTTPTNGYAVGGREVLKYTEIIGISPIGGIVPEDYKLFQNYPNPFNPKTTIEFDIPKSEFTRLIIYDALGREVAVLVNDELKAGRYKVDWNAPKGQAGNYSSGIYYYQLRAGDYKETKKMVLIK